MRLQSIPLAIVNRQEAYARHFESVVGPRTDVTIPHDVAHALEVDPCHSDTTIVRSGECKRHLVSSDDDKLPISHLVCEGQGGLAGLGRWRAHGLDRLSEVLAGLFEVVPSSVNPIVLAKRELGERFLLRRIVRQHFQLLIGVIQFGAHVKPNHAPVVDTQDSALGLILQVVLIELSRIW